MTPSTLILLAFANLLILYFVSYGLLNALFLGLFLVEFFRRPADEEPIPEGEAPKVSLLVPAYNEEKVIVQTVRSLMTLDYPDFEIVVVDDGSRDRTSAVLLEAFPFQRVEVDPAALPIPTQPLKVVYRAAAPRPVWLAVKENGGKSDALNAGLNLASGEIVVTIDADTILTPQSLRRIVVPFRDPRIVAVGGLLTVANETVWQAGRLVGQGLPRSPLALFQLVEYLVSYTIGRMALSKLNALLVLSGAFSAFRRDLLLQIRGFLSERAHGRHTVCEDAEIIFRLHRCLYDHRIPGRMVFLMRPVAWTEVPANARDVLRQRNRWHRGLGESLWLHRAMAFDPKYGRIGLFAIPYYLFFEFLAPFMKVLAFLLIGLLVLLDLVHGPFVLTLIVVSLLVYGLATAILTTTIEVRFQKASPDNVQALRYQGLKDWLLLILASLFVEPVFGTLRLIGQLWGFWDFLIGKRSWYKYERQGVTHVDPLTQKE